MIPVIVLHQLFNQPFMNRDILYTEKNILVEVDGTVDIDEVFAAIVNVLGA